MWFSGVVWLLHDVNVVFFEVHPLSLFTSHSLFSVCKPLETFGNLRKPLSCQLNQVTPVRHGVSVRQQELQEAPRQGQQREYVYVCMWAITQLSGASVCVCSVMCVCV